MKDFNFKINALRDQLKNLAPQVKNARWQSVAAPQPSRELLNVTLKLDLESENPEHYRKMIQPNHPWAEDAFKERVCGEPLNPGEQWKHWPFTKSADTHRHAGVFDHTYAERYWPKYAGMTPEGKLEILPTASAHGGIRFAYGDLDDLVTILSKEPTTRQAYLPIFFPEDLGAALRGNRVPCTLGYHFICRDNKLHIVYYIRSCDFIRHFRDDVYMTIRLLLWVLCQCRLAAPENDWAKVCVGSFTMHITSLHVFEGDVKVL